MINTLVMLTVYVLFIVISIPVLFYLIAKFLSIKPIKRWTDAWLDKILKEKGNE